MFAASTIDNASASQPVPSFGSEVSVVLVVTLALGLLLSPGAVAS
jgi:hypothetical protein